MATHRDVLRQQSREERLLVDQPGDTPDRPDRERVGMFVRESVELLVPLTSREVTVGAAEARQLTRFIADGMDAVATTTILLEDDALIVRRSSAREVQR